MMSFLTPLYALGALAIAAPIVFHLIRRTPSGEVPFSSLMFLEPSPPRLSKRSHLDQVLLLLLRAAVLGLLAIAFARPFLLASALVDSSNDGTVGRHRVALLIDTSASMRRGDLWSRAKSIVAETIAGIRPTDQLAIFAFDTGSRAVLGFDESKTLDPERRQTIARQRVEALKPTWASTQLGQALVDVAIAIDDVTDDTEKAGTVPRRVVLISDLQKGSRLDALGKFEWPSDVLLELKPVVDPGANAGLQGLPGAPGAEASDPGLEESVRVRVSNEAGTRDTFALAWAGSDGIPIKGEPPIPAYVPPGESRVIRVSRLKGNQAKPSTPSSREPARLILSGDERDFDNTLFLDESTREEATIVYLGDEGELKSDDPKGLLYYLRRAFVDTPRRIHKVVAEPASSSARPGWDSSWAPALVVLAAKIPHESALRLRAYVEQGGTVLGVLTGPGKATALADIVGGGSWEFAEARVGRDSLLGEIAFDHPLFAPFAAPQFNDFTKVHFWKYRRLDPSVLGENVRVLAKFEKGAPAVVEKTIGKGRLVILTSGWHPADSQLARSSKFVPLMMSLSERHEGDSFVSGTVLIGDRVPLRNKAEAPTSVRKPDGTQIALSPNDSVFSSTDQPGVYALSTRSGERRFAVNLDPSESRVALLDFEALEQLGVRLAKSADEQAEATVDPERKRQLQNAELEARQKFWRWLLLATIVFVIAETWFSGRLSRPRSRTEFSPAPAEVLAS